MRSGVIAQKVGMTRVFTDSRRARAGDGAAARAAARSSAHRTKDKNGYVALQLGSGYRQGRRT